MEEVGGANHAAAAAVEHMGVYLRRADIGMAQELLHGSNVVDSLHAS